MTWNPIMRTCLLGMALMTVATACGGCMTYRADNLFSSRGEVRTLDGELKDLKIALDRGAITLDEYEKQKTALTSSFGGGGMIVTAPLSEEESREFLKIAGEPDLDPIQR